MHGEAPPQHKPTGLAGYLEALTRPVFQAGMSWRVIEAKWAGIREAFAGFDPVTVAEYGPDDVARLLGDPRMVRSKAKIEATVDNAQALLELHAEHGGFDRYLRSRGGFEKTVADLKRQLVHRRQRRLPLPLAGRRACSRLRHLAGQEMSERNKALVRKIYRATETGDAAILDSVVTEKVIEHPLNPGQPPGCEALKQIRGAGAVTLSGCSY